VRRFPGAPDLGLLMYEAGLDDVRYRLLGGGIVALHVGTVAA
jgi:ubiquinone/menaquinone biosynthesis C-methylase UbiE